MTPDEALVDLFRIGQERTFRRDDAPLLVTHDQARALRALEQRRQSDRFTRGLVPTLAAEEIPLGFPVRFVVDQAAATLPDWHPETEGTTTP